MVGRQRSAEEPSVLLDGAPNNAQPGGNNVALVPIGDTVQQFWIQQNPHDAHYGKTGGGMVNVVLNSGRQDLQVTAQEFARRNWLDANTFQNNALQRKLNAKVAKRRPHQLGLYRLSSGSLTGEPWAVQGGGQN